MVFDPFALFTICTHGRLILGCEFVRMVDHFSDCGEAVQVCVYAICVLCMCMCVNVYMCMCMCVYAYVCVPMCMYVCV